MMDQQMLRVNIKKLYDSRQIYCVYTFQELPVEASSSLLILTENHTQHSKDMIAILIVVV